MQTDLIVIFVILAVVLMVPRVIEKFSDEPSAKGDPVVMSKFRKRLWIQTLLAIVFLPVVAPLILMRKYQPHPPFVYGLPVNTYTVLACVAGVVVIVLSVVNWRCPACNGYLGRSMLPRFCNKCGERLR